MKRFPCKLVTVLLVTVATSACPSLGSLATGITTNVPSSRLTDAAYVSPGGEYTVRVPRLIKPGMTVEEHQADEGTHLVAFGDDFGHIYAVEMASAPQPRRTVHEFAAGLTLDERLREKDVVTTARGPELRAVFVLSGGSPLVATTIEGGTRTERSLDLIQARSLFLTEQHAFTVSASRTRLEESMTDDVLIQGVKSDLEDFLAGLVVHQP